MKWIALCCLSRSRVYESIRVKLSRSLSLPLWLLWVRLCFCQRFIEHWRSTPSWWDLTCKQPWPYLLSQIQSRSTRHKLCTHSELTPQPFCLLFAAVLWPNRNVSLPSLPDPLFPVGGIRLDCGNKNARCSMPLRFFSFPSSSFPVYSSFPPVPSPSSFFSPELSLN